MSARLTFLTVMSLVAGGLVAAPAQAADLLPPAPVLDYGEEVVEIGTGWYLRGDIGYVDYNRPKDLSFGLPGTRTLDGERLDKTWSVGGGIGYAFTNGFRADVTVDYRIGAEFSGTRPIGVDYSLGYVRDQTDFESTTALFNTYFDLGTWSGITPYVGAGIGVSGNRFTNISREAWTAGTPAGSAGLQPHTAYSLAWALMGGVAVDVGSGFKVDLGYRFVHLGDARTRTDDFAYGIRTSRLHAHEFRIGARYMID
jgi:opacity protein-like surface antigen